MFLFFFFPQARLEFCTAMPRFVEIRRSSKALNLGHGQQGSPGETAKNMCFCVFFGMFAKQNECFFFAFFCLFAKKKSVAYRFLMLF